jgi:hypothetical protein
MVKSIFNYPNHASDAVNQRTVPISEKPHIGAELFPRYDARLDVFPDLENLSFERSIYNRLQTVKLRAPEAASSKLVIVERHWNEESGREISRDLHRALARDALSAQSLNCLSAIVVPLSKTCLQERLHNIVDAAKLRRTPTQIINTVRSSTTSKLSGGVIITSVDQLGVQNVWGSDNSSGQCWSNVFLLTSRTVDLRLADVCGMSQSEEGNRIVSAVQMFCALKKDNHDVRHSDESGFSTAPLRYLQSMATGPPGVNSSQE